MATLMLLMHSLPKKMTAVYQDRMGFHRIRGWSKKLAMMLVMMLAMADIYPFHALVSSRFDRT